MNSASRAASDSPHDALSSARLGEALGTEHYARDAHAQWNAHLDLRFETRPTRTSALAASNAHETFLAHRLHLGPLRIQKPLYPEGPGICHAVIVHPPGGIAGGDVLKIDIDVGANSHAVLTTPGATKWYKSNQRSSRQSVRLQVGDGARLDWLPQNNLFFHTTRAALDLHLTVAPTAGAIGWETTQLGRQAAGEQWRIGDIRSKTTLDRPDGRLLWAEQLVLTADDPIREAQQGLNGWPVFGTLWAVLPERRPVTDGVGQTGAQTVAQTGSAASGESTSTAQTNAHAAMQSEADADAALLQRLTDLLGFDDQLRGGVTRLPEGVILIRAVARRIEPLQALFIACWEILRPAVHGVPAQTLRIWST